LLMKNQGRRKSRRRRKWRKSKKLLHKGTKAACEDQKDD
jgi:hypothetical protein